MTTKPAWMTNQDEIKMAHQWLRTPQARKLDENWWYAFGIINNGDGLGTVRTCESASATLTEQGWIITRFNGQIEYVNDRRQWDDLITWERI